ncbi:MAG: hypothetical protein ACRC4M_02675 [Mycoplasma sp.]
MKKRKNCDGCSKIKWIQKEWTLCDDCFYIEEYKTRVAGSNKPFGVVNSIDPEKIIYKDGKFVTKK